VVWIPRKKKEESSAAQRGKYTAKRCIVKRTGKHSKGESKKRDIRRMFKILRKVWLDIGLEKVDTHEDVTVKALLDSGTT